MAGSRVILYGPYHGGGFSSGVDTIELLETVPKEYNGWIWTDRIELIGPALKLKWSAETDQKGDAASGILFNRP